MLENAVDGAIGRAPVAGLMQFPFDGRHTDLSKTLRFEPTPDFYDAGSFDITDTVRIRVCCMRP